MALINVNGVVASIVGQYLDLKQLLPFFGSEGSVVRFEFWMNGGIRGKVVRYVVGFFPNIVFARAHVMLWDYGIEDVNVWCEIVRGKVVRSLFVNCSMQSYYGDMRDASCLRVLFKNVSGIEHLVLYRVNVRRLGLGRGVGVESRLRLKSLRIVECRECYGFENFVDVECGMLRVMVFERCYWEFNNGEELCRFLGKCVGLRKIGMWGCGMDGWDVVRFDWSGSMNSLRYLSWKVDGECEIELGIRELRLIKVGNGDGNFRRMGVEGVKLRKMVVVDLTNEGSNRLVCGDVCSDILEVRGLGIECLMVKFMKVNIDDDMWSKFKCVKFVNCKIINRNVCSGVGEIVVINRGYSV